MKIPILSKLFNPLHRIAAASESNNALTSQIHTVLTVDLKKAAIETHKELKKQTAILGDIRQLLKTTKKENKDNKKGASGGVKMPDMMGVVKGGFAVVLMAGALVAASGILSFMVVPTTEQLLSTLAIAAVFAILAPVFSKISASITQDAGESLTGKLTGVGLKDILKSAGIMVLTMVGMATAIALSSWVLSLVKVISMETFLSALAIAAVMVPLAIAAAKLIDAMKEGGVSMDMAGVGMVAMMPLIMVGMAAGIVAASWVLSYTKTIDDKTFWAALMVGIIMIPLGIAAAALMIGMKEGGIEMNLKGVGKVLLLPLVMGALALGIVAAAWAMQLLPSKFVAPDVQWSLDVGLALFVFSASFALIAHSVKGLGAKGMFAAAFAIPIIALGIVAAAWIMQLLPAVFVAPPAEWSWDSGLALAVFSISFAVMAVVAKLVGIKGLLLGLLGVAAVAIGILAAAWIFSVLPSDFVAPDSDWAFNAALAIFMFSIPLGVIGGLAMLLTPVGLLLGAVGMILIAGVIWVVAWIFSKLPDVNVSAMDKMARGLMSPLHAMIDVLKRFKEEIGIKNMLGLAGGIMAIAASWLMLTAAIVGQAIGGVGSALGNAASGFINWAAGNEEETPFTILDGLAKRSRSIIKLGKPLGNIARAMSTAGLEPFIKAIHSVKKLSHYDIESPATQLERVRDVFKAIGYYAGALKSAFMPLHILMKKTSTMISLAIHLRIVAAAYGEFAKSTHQTNIPAVWASVAMFNSLSRLAGIANAMVMVQMAVASISSNSDRFILALSPISNLTLRVRQQILEQSANSIKSISDSFQAIIDTAGSIEDDDLFLTSELFKQFRKLARLAEPIELISISFTNISKEASNVAGSIKPLEVFFNMKNALAFRHSANSLNKMQKSYGKFANHTRKINIEAVNASTRMFTALSDLAKADGDSVMKILAEELFKATKELSIVVERLETTVQSQAEAQRGSGNLIEDALSALKGAIQGSTAQASATVDAMEGTQEVRVVNFDQVILALNEVEDRLGLPLTVSMEDEA